MIQILFCCHIDLMNKTFSSAESIPLGQQKHRTAVGPSARDLKSGGRSVEALRPAHEVRHVDAQVVARPAASTRIIIFSGKVFSSRPRTLMRGRSDEARMVVLLVECGPERGVEVDHFKGLAGGQLDGRDAGWEGRSLSDDGELPAAAVVSGGHRQGGSRRFEAARATVEAVGSVGGDQGGVERSLRHSQLSGFLVIHLHFCFGPAFTFSNWRNSSFRRMHKIHFHFLFNNV